MTQVLTTSKELTGVVLAAPRMGRRRIVALAGAPASGKSTLGVTLAKALCDTGCPTQVVPMDGFHLNNDILTDRGLLSRKGSPDTFDASGFLALVSRLHDEEEVFHPIFDRSRDIAIAAGGVVRKRCDTVIVEGNYLLYDAPIWRELGNHWDVSVFLDVQEDALRARLVARWLEYGLPRDKAERRAAENDLLNAQLVAACRSAASVVLVLPSCF